MLTRREFIKKSTLSSLLIASGLYYSCSNLQYQKPNIILFIADDISQNDFGCYGHPTIQTPVIDSLAENHGIRFTNAYLTISSCSPTRTSLITGRYPHNTGGPELHMNKNSHLKDLPQFPHELKQAGYYTAQAGKWHFNGDVTKSFNQKYKGGVSGADNWVKALQDRPKDQPFFMWFAAFDAHRGWDMDLEEGPHGSDDVMVPAYLIDGAPTRNDLAQYYNEVHRFDKNVGKVVHYLKSQNLYENTIIIVIADNGRPFPRDKTWLFDSGIKMPFILHWPERIKSSEISNSLVSILDIPPTLLDIVQIEKPDTFQGVSLIPMINNSKIQVRDFVFAERNWHGQRYHDRMVRFRDFVYIKNNMPKYLGFNLVHYGKLNQPAYVELVDEWKKGNLNKDQEHALLKPRPKEMLFNVAEDPHQLNNLANNSKYKKQLNLLRKALQQWTDETGDTVPPFDEMTPERNSRETWLPVIASGHPDGGVIPGQSTNAWMIHHSGPVHAEDILAD